MKNIYTSLHVLILSVWASSTLAEPIFLTCDMVSTTNQRNTIEFWFDLDAGLSSLSSKREDISEAGDNILLHEGMDRVRARGGTSRATFAVNRYDLSIWTLFPSADGQCIMGRREKQF
jgi:hypothetical protein